MAEVSRATRLPVRDVLRLGTAPSLPRPVDMPDGELRPDPGGHLG